MIEFKGIHRSSLEQMRGWRNSAEIYNFCRQTSFISELDQERWYDRQNDDPTIQMFEIHAPPKEDLYQAYGVISDEAARTLVGICGLTSIDHLHRRAEFSLYIGPEHQGQGFAKEALRKLCLFGVDALNLNVIWGETFDRNPAAMLFTKLGFKLEGTRRSFYYKNGKCLDAHLYSIMRNELK